MDQVCDTYNRVHGCEIASEAERDIRIQQASGFNELFEASSKKESEQGEVYLGLGPRPAHEADSESQRKGQENRWFGLAVEEIKKLTKHLVKEANAGSPEVDLGHGFES